MLWNKTAFSLKSPPVLKLDSWHCINALKFQKILPILFQQSKLSKLGTLCFRGRWFQIWYYFLGGEPLKVSSQLSKKYFEIKKFRGSDYWLPAATHLKNNIIFEICDLENIKHPTLKALIAEIIKVEFFEIWCIVMYCKLPIIDFGRSLFAIGCFTLF